MFLNAPPNPTRLKHLAYLIAAVTIGVLAALLAYAGGGVVYLFVAQSVGRSVVLQGWNPLPPAVLAVLVAVGAAGGLALGRFWWRKVYVERTWAVRYSCRKES